ncbi:MAG TPA: PEGA domain-containing protein [Methanoregulaceae archaeon]|nr:PEGA domain-containing protein [Methanoregulaceae archaeon]
MPLQPAYNEWGWTTIPPTPTSWGVSTPRVPTWAGKGTLYVASYPTNATILINGTNYGTTNKSVNNVPAGIQNLTLTKEGYQPYTTIVCVPGGGLKVLAPITLSRSGGSPVLPGMAWPTGYGKFESKNNARGIYYNDQLYVWSIYWTSDTFVQTFHPKLLYRIEYRTFKDGQLSGSSYLWDGKSEAEPTPVIVQYPNNGPKKMFVFVTGRDGNIYFTRLNGTVWEDGDWLKIADSATGQYITTKEKSWEVAPVYDPDNHRLYLYYAKNYNDYLYVVYSDDYGNTWHNPGKVVNSPIVKSPPGAVLYHDPSNNVVLLAVKDSDQKIRICHMGLNFVESSEVLPTPTSDNINGYGRPFLTDVGNGYIALMYAAEHGDQAYCPDWYVPHISLFDKATGQWGEAYQAATLPDLGVAQGEYEFHWQPNGAMDPTSDTFYLFYGFELCALYTDTSNNGPWWMFVPIKTPGT